MTQMVVAKAALVGESPAVKRDALALWHVAIGSAVFPARGQVEACRRVTLDFVHSSGCERGVKTVSAKRFADRSSGA